MNMESRCVWCFWASRLLRTSDLFPWPLHLENVKILPNTHTHTQVYAAILVRTLHWPSFIMCNLNFSPGQLLPDPSPLPDLSLSPTGVSEMTSIGPPAGPNKAGVYARNGHSRQQKHILMHGKKWFSGSNTEWWRETEHLTSSMILSHYKTLEKPVTYSTFLNCTAGNTRLFPMQRMLRIKIVPVTGVKKITELHNTLLSLQKLHERGVSFNSRPTWITWV